MSERDIANRTLADAIRRIEALHGNDTYMKAWGRAVRALREMMVEVNQSIIADAEQIDDV